MSTVQSDLTFEYSQCRIQAPKYLGAAVVQGTGADICDYRAIQKLLFYTYRYIGM